MSKQQNDPLLTPDESRYVMFPIQNQGIWSMNLNASRDPVLTKPRPSFPGAYSTFPQNALPQINYWVTSLGKIHRPGCSFYERGRGTLTQTPRGQNCRICGGNKR